LTNSDRMQDVKCRRQKTEVRIQYELSSRRTISFEIKIRQLLLAVARFE
jgi:hypothetical protein